MSGPGTLAGLNIGTVSGTPLTGGGGGQSRWVGTY